MGDYGPTLQRQLRDADASGEQAQRPLFGNPFRILVRRLPGAGEDSEFSMLDGVDVGAEKVSCACARVYAVCDWCVSRHRVARGRCDRAR
jgi:hypothetical protein